MFPLFANLYVLLTWGPHMVYKGTPYIFHIYMIRCGWLGSGDRFLTGGVFKCDISHRRSVAVLCMLYKIRCNTVHPINGALPGPYVPTRVTRCALVGHRHTYAPPRCWSLPYSTTFIPFSVPLWNDLADPVFDGFGLAGFKSRANDSLFAYAALFLLYTLSGSTGSALVW